MKLNVAAPVGQPSILLELNGVTGTRERARLFARTARDGLRQVQAEQRRALGRARPVETIVDGQRGVPVESVNPDGEIIFEFLMLDDVFPWVADSLESQSPELSGNYKRSHLMFAGDQHVDPRGKVPLSDRYTFVNAAVYSRKIEKRGFSRQAPDGVYEAVALLAGRRFRGVADFRFTYVPVTAGAVDAWADGAESWAHSQGRRGDKAQWLRRQPAIVLTPRG